MPIVYADRVWETSATTGTGTLTLAGAVAGFRTAVSVTPSLDGKTITYCIEDGTNWEVGEGVFTAAGTTLSRLVIIASSNANAAVNWVAGTRNVFLCQSARDANNRLASDTLWDAAGDLVIGSGADTAVKLTVDTAGGKALASDPGATNKLGWQYPQGVYEASGGTTGCLAATYDRGSSLINAAPTIMTSGTLRLHRILLPKGLSITNIAFFAGNVALAAGTSQWFGLFDSSRVVLAKTADDTNVAWGTNAKKSLAITGGPFVTTYAGWHYLGILVAAGTMPQISCITSLPTTGPRNMAPLPAGDSTTGLTNPASCTGTQTAITLLNQLAYAEVS